MLNLLIIMLERVGIIIAVAFLLTRFQFFKNMISYDQMDRKHEIPAIVFFGFFGITGTYLGVALDVSTSQFNHVTLGLTESEAIANSRVIGVVIAGLLGGYRVGIGAGLIAGIHRMALGGFTAFSCGFSTIIAGIVSGLFHKKGKNAKPLLAFFLSAAAEAMQMGFILLLSRPFEKSLALVEVIGIPMILANGVGAALFILIIHSVIGEQEKITAQQAQKTLRIAEQTLSYLRKGMNTKTAIAVCEILYKELQPSAVAMTDKSKILAHVGIGSDHHYSNSPILTRETRQVIQSGILTKVRDGTIHCEFASCPLGAAVIAPLTQRDEIIGTLKLYYPSEKQITDATIELITGLSSLLGNQLEIAEADRAHELAKEAEIIALQAQISPHFLFNSLNMIMSLIRTSPDQARELLGSLSYFLRQNVTETMTSKVTLEQELSHVKAYLSLIEARFIDRLTVEYDIAPSALNEMVPPFVLQPIVENAMQHGMKNRGDNCLLKITIADDGDTVGIAVTDNGKGIPPERMKMLGKERLDSDTGTGMGLFNVNRRLQMMFGNTAALKFKSKSLVGTTVSFEIEKGG